MEFIILHNQKNDISDGSYLRFAMTSKVTRSLVLNGIKSARQRCCIAIPAEWNADGDDKNFEDKIIYKNNTLKYVNDICCSERSKWTIITNGRYITNYDKKLLNEIIETLDCDFVMVQVDPELSAYSEKVRITPSRKVAGFRRWYYDSITAADIAGNWPHLIFIRSDKVGHLLLDGDLGMDFESVFSKSQINGLKAESINIGGSVTDLNTETGLLKFMTSRIRSVNLTEKSKMKMRKNDGSVAVAENAEISKDARVLGPSIIEDDVSIADGAIVNNSIIGPSVVIQRGQVIDNCIITKECLQKTAKKPSIAINGSEMNYKQTQFRKWPKLSYPEFTKRLIDIAGSLVILILFAPIFPVIALAIKLTSRGPIFYKALRQGLHGNPIHCIKFRTMIVNADTMQEKLRAVNEVDGPQFKMADDPRVSKVGKFLRDTCLDEIPQFINVLLGQMSIVGPRPSPEIENSQCPAWRDARLSVRPGITGMWQICRTRRQGRDFQEWVYYDTVYVRNISLKLDFWICLKTAMKLTNDFFDQF